MNRFSVIALVGSLMLLPLAVHAADAKVPEAAQAEPLKAKKKKAEKLDKKFCCKTESGTGCYVFGDASCTNCTSFCSGNMVIEAITR